MDPIEVVIKRRLEELLDGYKRTRRNAETIHALVLQTGVIEGLEAAIKEVDSIAAVRRGIEEVRTGR